MTEGARTPLEYCFKYKLQKFYYNLIQKYRKFISGTNIFWHTSSRPTDEHFAVIKCNSVVSLLYY